MGEIWISWRQAARWRRQWLSYETPSLPHTCDDHHHHVAEYDDYDDEEWHSLASSDQDKMEHKRTEPIREEIPSTDDLLITMMDMTMGIMTMMIVMVKRSTWSAPHSWAVFFGLRCHITLQQWGNIMIMMVLMLHMWRLLLVQVPYSLDSRWKYVEWKFW